MTVSLIQEELVEALDGESASAKVLGWEREQVSGIWSHHFMANRWGNNGNRADFIFSGSNITADGDCSHEIKKRLLLGRKAMTNLAAAAAAAKSLQSCLTLCDPIDGNPPSSPVPGILQARILDWVAISFSSA